MKKVLVIDDEADILKVVAFRLKTLGCKVITAVDGKEGLKMAQEEKPDLIILDAVMPVMDGYEFCRARQKSETLKQIPVILMTATSVSKIEEKAKVCKADDSLVKPFSTEELIGKVKRFIKKGGKDA